ncbi:MAG: hypothetical protein BJ554DRAFT_4768, partial [Olpidium bornovanus]
HVHKYDICLKGRVTIDTSDNSEEKARAQSHRQNLLAYVIVPPRRDSGPSKRLVGIANGRRVGVGGGLVSSFSLAATKLAEETPRGFGDHDNCEKSMDKGRVTAAQRGYMPPHAITGGTVRPGTDYGRIAPPRNAGYFSQMGTWRGNFGYYHRKTRRLFHPRTVPLMAMFFIGFSTLQMYTYVSSEPDATCFPSSDHARQVTFAAGWTKNRGKTVENELARVYRTAPVVECAIFVEGYLGDCVQMHFIILVNDKGK